jgi:uncharacterized protein (TIGR02271 family)
MREPSPQRRKREESIEGREPRLVSDEPVPTGHEPVDMVAARTTVDVGGPIARMELDNGTRRLELHEEQLVARKELVEAGEVVLHTEIDEAPARLEIDAFREEVEIEHEPVGKIVSERAAPWEENGDFVVPVYEEQLVVVKRLVLREQLRIRRMRTTEHQTYEDQLRRERLVIDDPDSSGLVQEKYPVEEDGPAASEHTPHEGTHPAEPGLLSNVVRRVLG